MIVCRESNDTLLCACSQSPPRRWKWSGDSCALCRHMLVGHVLQRIVVDVFVAGSLVSLRRDIACATSCCMHTCLTHRQLIPREPQPPGSRCSIDAQTAVRSMHARTNPLALCFGAIRVIPSAWEPLDFNCAPTVAQAGRAGSLTSSIRARVAELMRDRILFRYRLHRTHPRAAPRRAGRGGAPVLAESR